MWLISTHDRASFFSEIAFVFTWMTMESDLCGFIEKRSKKGIHVCILQVAREMLKFAKVVAVRVVGKFFHVPVTNRQIWCVGLAFS